MIAVLVASSVTRRVRRLRDAAERIAEGDLTARADVSGGGEIEELAEAFNTMAERVEGVVESQRGFAGDASHQLRTPLTALRLRLDRAAELMSDDDPAVGQVDAARDEIDRLQRLVDGLLVLARAEGRDQETVPVDITQIATDRVEAWQPLADERSVRIELDAPGMAVAQAVPSATEQIIDNYVDNALEVAPGGQHDPGDGAARGRRRAGARRRRRARASRPRTGSVPSTASGAGRQDGGGSGLGLAVVASLAEAGGGHVWLAESPRGGLRAAARFAR